MTDTPQHILKRIELQDESVQAFINTYNTPHPYRMAFYYGTGVGKTKLSIDCVKWFDDTVMQGQGLIVCHSTVSRDSTWPAEIEKWGNNHKTVINAKRVCYKSLSNLNHGDYSWMIMDEAHYLTEPMFRFFEFNRVKAIIVLTATRPRKPEKQHMLDMLVGKNTLKLKADKAIEMGILNDYNIEIFEVDLDNTERDVKAFKNDDNLYTEWEAYLKHCVHIQTKKDKHQLELMRFGYINLMRFLGSSKTKTKVAKYIINKFREKNRRFVVFANSIAQAEELSPFVYHSQTTDTFYQMLLEGRIDELASVDQIREGANIDNLTRILNIQVDTDPLPTVQKIGRILRLEPGQMASAFFIVFRNTFDAQWSKKTLKENDPKKVKHRFLPQSEYWHL